MNKKSLTYSSAKKHFKKWKQQVKSYVKFTFVLYPRVLSDHNNAYHESATSLLNVRNSEGKSPLDMACMLGRVNILKLLIKYGADLSSSTPSGKPKFAYKVIFVYFKFFSCNADLFSRYYMFHAFFQSLFYTYVFVNP